MNVKQLSESLNIPYKKITRQLSQIEPATNWELDTEIPEVYQLQLQGESFTEMAEVPALPPTTQISLATANTDAPIDITLQPLASATASAYLTAYLQQYDHSLRLGINKVHEVVHEQLLQEAQQMEHRQINNMSTDYQSLLEQQLKQKYSVGKRIPLR